jgi:hypothetical protein
LTSLNLRARATPPATSRSSTLGLGRPQSSWAFATLITTIVLGVAAYVALDIAKMETSTLREWLQTTISGEIGLIAGFSGSRSG